MFDAHCRYPAFQSPKRQALASITCLVLTITLEFAGCLKNFKNTTDNSTCALQLAKYKKKNKEKKVLDTHTALCTKHCVRSKQRGKKKSCFHEPLLLVHWAVALTQATQRCNSRSSRNGGCPRLVCNDLQQTSGFVVVVVAAAGLLLPTRGRNKKKCRGAVEQRRNEQSHCRGFVGSRDCCCCCCCGRRSWLLGQRRAAASSRGGV